MTHDELIARALAFPGAAEDYPFGDDLLTVKVGGKVFAWIPLGHAGWLGPGTRMAVKLPASLVTELHHAYPDQVRPARPLDQRYWVTIPLAAGVPRTARSASCSPCPTGRLSPACPETAAPPAAPPPR